uniref:ATP synthase subunit a n=1 Tax=Timarete posteria TaxID=2291963 RepID=A0A513X8R5_9ANNE|nr:ATP synthase F0 subunit 6 [Timarete posteria]QDH12178.1 ATP synthase F0 subunit 6 [Timarete posteria]
MLYNVFSSMEPSGFFNLNFFALCSFLSATSIYLFFAPTYWVAPSYFTQTTNTLLSFILLQMTPWKKSFSGWDMFIPATFFMLIFFNLTGLIPYTFSITTFPTMTFPLGFMLWLAPLFIFFKMNMKAFFASFLPASTPLWLAPFMTLIELTSILLRPLTLAFRITANMTAGHLILLLSSGLTFFLYSSSTSIMLFMLLVQSGYVLFEVAVCFLQATIFCMLLIQYTKAH